MKFTLATALLVAGIASAQSCPEAARFGVLSVNPSTVTEGQVIAESDSLRLH